MRKRSGTCRDGLRRHHYEREHLPAVKKQKEFPASPYLKRESERRDKRGGIEEAGVTNLVISRTLEEEKETQGKEKPMQPHFSY